MNCIVSMYMYVYVCVYVCVRICVSLYTYTYPTSRLTSSFSFPAVVTLWRHLVRSWWWWWWWWWCSRSVCQGCIVIDGWGWWSALPDDAACLSVLRGSVCYVTLCSVVLVFVLCWCCTYPPPARSSNTTLWGITLAWDGWQLQFILSRSLQTFIYI